MISDFLKQFYQLFSWFFVVAPWEQAIRVRLGKKSPLLNAGWYFKVPFIDRIFCQTIRYRMTNLKAQTLTTKDGKVITCGASVGYSIKDLNVLYDTIEQPLETINNEVSGLVSEFVGSHNISECTIPSLQKYVMEKMDLRKYGLEGERFYVISFATAKTLRIITGDVCSWQCDEGKLSMLEPNQRPR